MPSTPLRLGTRGSSPARWQAEWVAARLVELGQAVELVPISTRGDQSTGEAIEQISGGQGVFTKEIQRALLDGRVDLAVHSLKDLPTDEVAGLALATVPERESPADVLVCRQATSLAGLPPSARVGTGDLRRQAQLFHLRGDLKIESVRGNVDTRLRKVDEGEFDAIVLAEAGLNRLGLAERITQRFDPAEFLSAVGQGALGIESRADDETTRAALAPLDDRPTRVAVLAERTLLATLRGGCLAPIGAHARLDPSGGGDRLVLTAVVLSPDGQQRLLASQEARSDDYIALGQAVAKELLDAGAAALIDRSRTRP